MANKKYEIRYLPTFISQFNNILYYITYELKNKIAADNFYNEVVKQIEIRSNTPEAYEVFKTIKNNKIKYYKINVRKYTIFYHSFIFNSIILINNFTNVCIIYFFCIFYYIKKSTNLMILSQIIYLSQLY